jgi:hypothetical protein
MPSSETNKVYCNCCDTYVTRQREREHRALLFADTQLGSFSPPQHTHPLPSTSTVKTKQVVTVSDSEDDEDPSLPQAQPNDFDTTMGNMGFGLSEAEDAEQEVSDDEEDNRLLSSLFEGTQSNLERAAMGALLEEESDDDDEVPGISRCHESEGTNEHGDDSDLDSDDEGWLDWEGFERMVDDMGLGEGFERDAAGVGESASNCPGLK